MSDELITYLFPDINAVKYFQREFETLNEFHIVEYSSSSGFDIYLVEQWANSRNIGTLISTYTGNFNNSVNVIRFTIKKQPSKKYPLKFQEYLNELMLNYANIKYMNDHEILFVTNITSLPPNLSLIPILTGDYKSVEDNFIINSNLKKLQCTGRSMSLVSSKISDANEDKFRQMYRIYNLKIPIKFAIKQLINLVQICLFYFDLLDIRCCDGFLCCSTEGALINWWNLIGLPHYNIKPVGILPSDTVAGLISLVLSVKIRLQIYGGCDVPRDPFDVENFMISIGEFQKQVKLDKTRKLDSETFHKLLYVTNNKLKVPQASNNRNSYTQEFRKLTNVVMTTVQDRIYDDPKMEINVETLDLDILVGNLLGKTLKQLWGEEEGPTTGNSANIHHRHRHHHHHNSYRFASLKDTLMKNQKVQYDRKGLHRMRLGRYSTKQPINLTHKKSVIQTNLSGLSKVDELLQIVDPNEKPYPIASDGTLLENDQPSIYNDKNTTSVNNRLNCELNRRNSLPYTLNLNNISNAEIETSGNVFQSKPFLSRSNSFPSKINNLTVEKLAVTYLKDVNDLIELDKFSHSIESKKTPKFDELNNLLHSLKLNHNSLELNQANLVQKDLYNVIEANINSLIANLDRLGYESRIIVKRINELETISKLLKNKLRDQSSSKLTNIINNLIYLKKFNRVFEVEERDELILKLTDNSQEVLQAIRTRDEEGPRGFIQVLAIFVWEMMNFILQLFKFDRSKMNLERIRQIWVKLDPNRKYIERAYDFVGYDSAASLSQAANQSGLDKES